MKNKNLKWNENSVILLGLHLIIVMFALLNFNYQFLLHQKSTEIFLLENQKKRIESKIEDVRDDLDYQNTELFKEKNLKNLGYKKQGEIVIDTSVIEPAIVENQELENYVYDIDRDSENNIEKWLTCLFGQAGVRNNKANFCKK